METGSAGDLTQILRQVAAGDRAALDGLLVAVYDDLKALSARHMQQEPAGHTLQPTALVHEAYLKLIDQRSVAWRDRAHFFCAASQMMRRVLVDHARGKKSAKRGGDRTRLAIDDDALAADGQDVDLIALDLALVRLTEISELQARVVEMRFFGGMTIAQIAEVLAMGKRSIDREWSCAKAWLYREVTP